MQYINSDILSSNVVLNNLSSYSKYFNKQNVLQNGVRRGKGKQDNIVRFDQAI